jgi:uncharacterized Zn-finger protein
MELSDKPLDRVIHQQPPSPHERISTGKLHRKGNLPHTDASEEHLLNSSRSMTLSSDEDDRLDREYALQKQTKRHVCGLCCKRFNRPSSLRIHTNTHTGKVLLVFLEHADRII